MAEFTEDGSLVSQAPVFRPTEEEWLDPIAYICKIRGEAEPFGCCKIIPPPQFVLPFHLDREGVKLRARPQAVDKLCERGQVKAATAEFQADFARFLELAGSTKSGKRNPVLAGQEIDLAKLYRAVEKRGGYEAVNGAKIWRDVARVMGLQCGDKSGNLASQLRVLYQKQLLKYEQFCGSKDEGADFLEALTEGWLKEQEMEQERAERAREERERERERKRGAGSGSTEKVEAVDEEDAELLLQLTGGEGLGEGEGEAGEGDKGEDKGGEDADGDAKPAAKGRRGGRERAARGSGEGRGGEGEEEGKGGGEDGKGEAREEEGGKRQRKRMPVQRLDPDAPTPPPPKGPPRKKRRAEAPQEVTEDVRAPENIDELLCEVCRSGEHEDRIILCDRCDRGYHMYCLSPPMRGVPSGDWLCPLCGGHGPATLGDLDLTYRQLERRSNEAERTLMRFSSRRPAVEAETPTEEHAREIVDRFWSVVEGADEPMTVMYAADVPSSVYGAGGPNAEWPWGMGDLPRWRKEAEAPGSADGDGADGDAVETRASPGAALASESMLRHVPESQLGHLGRSRLDVGICGSTCGWRLEPHLLYSMSVLHHGKPRAVYTVPPQGTAALEEMAAKAMEDGRKALEGGSDAKPGQTVARPLQLPRLVPPDDLADAGVAVTEVYQEQGEVVVIFPGVYHAEVLAGYSVVERVDFAPPDWLRYGGPSVDRFLASPMPPSFCHEELVLAAARAAVAGEPVSAAGALWLAWEVRRVAAREAESHVAGWAAEVRRSQAVGPLDPFPFAPDPRAAASPPCAATGQPRHLGLVTCESCAGVGATRAVCPEAASPSSLCACGARRWRLHYRYTVAELEDLADQLAAVGAGADLGDEDLEEAAAIPQHQRGMLIPAWSPGRALALALAAEAAAEEGREMPAELGPQEGPAMAAWREAAREWVTGAKDLLEGRVSELGAVRQLLSEAEAFMWGSHEVQEVRDLYRRLLDLKAWVDDVREAANRKNTLEELQALVGRLGALPVRFYEYNKVARAVAEYDTLRERIRVAVESPVRDLKDMEALDKDVQKLPVDLGEGVAQLHERVTAARKWCEAVRKAAPKKAASIAAMKERVTRDEMDTLLQQGLRMNMEVPEVRHLQDSIRRLDEWQEEVADLIDGSRKPTLEELKEAQASADKVPGHVPAMDAIAAAVRRVDAWMARLQGLLDRRASVKEIRDALASFDRLDVVLPDEMLSGFRTQMRRREWEEAAKRALSGRCTLTTARELLRQAGDVGAEGLDLHGQLRERVRGADEWLASSEALMERCYRADGEDGEELPSPDVDTRPHITEMQALIESGSRLQMRLQELNLAQQIVNAAAKWQRQARACLAMAGASADMDGEGPVDGPTVEDGPETPGGTGAATTEGGHTPAPSTAGTGSRRGGGERAGGTGAGATTPAAERGSLAQLRGLSESADGLGVIVDEMRVVEAVLREAEAWCAKAEAALEASASDDEAAAEPLRALLAEGRGVGVTMPLVARVEARVQAWEWRRWAGPLAERATAEAAAAGAEPVDLEELRRCVEEAAGLEVEGPTLEALQGTLGHAEGWEREGRRILQEVESVHAAVRLAEQSAEQKARQEALRQEGDARRAERGTPGAPQTPTATGTPAATPTSAWDVAAAVGEAEPAEAGPAQVAEAMRGRGRRGGVKAGRKGQAGRGRAAGGVANGRGRGGGAKAVVAAAAAAAEDGAKGEGADRGAADSDADGVRASKRVRKRKTFGEDFEDHLPPKRSAKGGKGAGRVGVAKVPKVEEGAGVGDGEEVGWPGPTPDSETPGTARGEVPLSELGQEAEDRFVELVVTQLQDVERPMLGAVEALVERAREMPHVHLPSLAGLEAAVEEHRGVARDVAWATEPGPRRPLREMLEVTLRLLRSPLSSGPTAELVAVSRRATGVLGRLRAALMRKSGAMMLSACLGTVERSLDWCQGTVGAARALLTPGGDQADEAGASESEEESGEDEGDGEEGEEEGNGDGEGEGEGEEAEEGPQSGLSETQPTKGRGGRPRKTPGGQGAAEWEGVSVAAGRGQRQRRAPTRAGEEETEGRGRGLAGRMRRVSGMGAREQCPCRGPEGSMVQCDTCTDSFHPKCVGLSQAQVKGIKRWVCPFCISLRDAGASPLEDPKQASRMRRTRGATAEQLRGLAQEMAELPWELPWEGTLGGILEKHERFLAEGRQVLRDLLAPPGCRLPRHATKAVRDGAMMGICKAAFACEIESDELWRAALTLLRGDKWRRRHAPLAARAVAREGPGPNAAPLTVDALQRLLQEGAAAGLDEDMDWCMAALTALERDARAWLAEARVATRDSMTPTQEVQELVARGEGLPLALGALLQKLRDRSRPYCLCKRPFDGRGMIECDACKDWYHWDCLGLSSEDPDVAEGFLCPECSHARGAVFEHTLPMPQAIQDKLAALGIAAQQTSGQRLPRSADTGVLHNPRTTQPPAEGDSAGGDGGAGAPRAQPERVTPMSVPGTPAAPVATAPLPAGVGLAAGPLPLTALMPPIGPLVPGPLPLPNSSPAAASAPALPMPALSLPMATQGVALGLSQAPGTVLPHTPITLAQLLPPGTQLAPGTTIVFPPQFFPAGIWAGGNPRPVMGPAPLPVTPPAAPAAADAILTSGGAASEGAAGTETPASGSQA